MTTTPTTAIAPPPVLARSADPLRKLYKVFLSYSTNNFPLVEGFRDVLKAANVDVFFAHQSVQAGEKLTAKLTGAITGCDVFVLIWSKEAKKSRWVDREIFLAMNQGKKIIPVILDGTPLPDALKDVKYLEAGTDSTLAMELLKGIIGDGADRKALIYIVGGLL